MARVVIAALLAALALAASAAEPPAGSIKGPITGPVRGPIEGRIKVLDGRTIRAGDTAYRLAGIDAPEDGQYCFNTMNNAWVPCGSISREALAEFLRGKGVACVSDGTAADGTPLAQCTRDGLSVNRLMVRYGMAMSAPDFTDEQDKARKKNAGLWKTRLVQPADWRAGTRLPGEPSGSR